jgi:pimeloyl-ACP methyl ester carboxylesterase
VEQRFETVAGIRGHALVGGSGPPIVLVHGLAVSSRYFVPLARRLAPRYAVLAPDLPGYGRSATPRRPLGIAELADALREWVDLAGIESAPLVANSMGCQIAVDLAVRAPERVRRLVLVGPTMDPSAPTLWAQWRRLVRDAIREPVGLNVAELRDYLRMGPLRIVATARDALAQELEPTLKRVRQPALVIRGEHDQIVSQAWAERVASALPEGRLVVVRGSAHATHWAAAGEVARLVEEFT